MNQPTQKSQEALQDAQTAALRLGHTEVDGEHLLVALLRQSDGLVPRLIGAIGADPDAVRADIEQDLARRPKVTGPGASPGQVFVTQRLSRILDAAQREANRLKDEYVSVEHLLRALAEEGSASAAGRRLKDSGSPGRRSCARLRTEIDSMPAEPDELTRRVMRLEIEEAALAKETDPGSVARLDQLRRELAPARG